MALSHGKDSGTAFFHVSLCFIEEIIPTAYPSENNPMID